MKKVLSDECWAMREEQVDRILDLHFKLKI
jgi:hypothetical protein